MRISCWKISLLLLSLTNLGISKKCYELEHKEKFSHERLKSKVDPDISDSDYESFIFGLLSHFYGYTKKRSSDGQLEYQRVAVHTSKISKN